MDESTSAAVTAARFTDPGYIHRSQPKPVRELVNAWFACAGRPRSDEEHAAEQARLARERLEADVALLAEVRDFMERTAVAS